MAGIGIAKRGLGLLAKGGRAGFKRAGPVTKADLAKRDLWRKRELKRRSKIGQRKSRWDIKGGISGHPLNPLRMHADAKAYDFTSKRKDVYGRTRDDLKKSRDPNVKKVAENFQKMDYLDEARSDPRYEKGTSPWGKKYAPKLTKRIHGRLGKKTGGRIGLQDGGPPSIDAKKIAKEKLREQYYKKHGRPGEFEKKAREARAKLVGSRKTLGVSDPHKRTRHSVYGLRKKGGKV